MTLTAQRVLMTADTVGGVWTHALQLARALGRHDVSVAIATMGAPASRAQQAEAAAVPNLELFTSDYRLEWMSDPWEDVDRAGTWLLEIEDRFNPDVVHLNGYCHASLPWRTPKLVVGHSCVLSWWRAVKDADAPPEWNVYREAVTAGLQAAEMVVAPSRAMLNALREHYGEFAATRVIPNGRDLPEMRLRSKEPMVLAAGRLWDEGKNIAALTKIAPHLPWPVCVVGEAADPDGREQPLAGVKKLGRLTPCDLQSWLERAAIYALPARYEPFGLSILEAALAGCALVLGDIPSLRELWQDAAEFVPPDDHDALQNALRRLIAAPAELAQSADRARAAARKLTAARMAREYLAAYAHLLSTRQQPQLSQEFEPCAS